MLIFGCGDTFLPEMTTGKKKHVPEVLLGNNALKNRTVEGVTATCRPKAEERFKPALDAAGLSFPPKHIYLLAFKNERRLEVYTENNGQKIKLHTYAFTALSGKRGPKRQEGDKQVPEGMYGVEYLNPNSRFHLSFKVSYPNARDKARAARAGIENAGTDIFIHGGAVSIGCIPIGDAYMEELFALVSLTGPQNVRVLIFPNDARQTGRFLPCEVCTDDTDELYTELAEALREF